MFHLLLEANIICALENLKAAIPQKTTLSRDFFRFIFP